jgi:hypothetical protein
MAADSTAKELWWTNQEYHPDLRDVVSLHQYDQTCILSLWLMYDYHCKQRLYPYKNYQTDLVMEQYCIFFEARTIIFFLYLDQLHLLRVNKLLIKSIQKEAIMANYRAAQYPGVYVE